MSCARGQRWRLEDSSKKAWKKVWHQTHLLHILWRHGGRSVTCFYFKVSVRGSSNWTSTQTRIKKRKEVTWFSYHPVPWPGKHYQLACIEYFKQWNLVAQVFSCFSSLLCDTSWNTLLRSQHTLSDGEGVRFPKWPQIVGKGEGKGWFCVLLLSWVAYDRSI